ESQRPGAGTPAYAAPEVLRGEAQDARADQYSFCVALHELLAGARPVRGEVSKRLPARVRAALERGLSAEPDGRFTSMAGLLEALQPRRQRPALWALGGLLLVL